MNAKVIFLALGAGVVGYVVYRQFIAAPSGSAQNTTQTPQAPAGQTSNTVPPASNSAPPLQATTQPAAVNPDTDSATILAGIAVLAAKDKAFINDGGTLKGTYDHWGYYWNRTKYGSAHLAPAPENLGITRGQNDTMSLAQFFALIKPAVNSSGLTGLVRGARTLRGEWDDMAAMVASGSASAPAPSNGGMSDAQLELALRNLPVSQPTPAEQRINAAVVAAFNPGLFDAPASAGSSVQKWMSVNSNLVYAGAGILALLAVLSALKAAKK